MSYAPQAFKPPNEITNIYIGNTTADCSVDVGGCYMNWTLNIIN